MPNLIQQLHLFQIIFAVLTGACLGSFANVLIYRLPRGIPFVMDVSRCPNCKKRIMPFDLIPVVSYIILRGKCRYCKSHISLRYPAVELLAGTLAAFAVLRYGFNLAALTCFLIFVVLTTISFIDVEHMMIPNGLVISLAVLAIAYAALCWNDNVPDMTSRVAGFFVLSLPMFILALLIKGAFGGGDIKLIAVCGFLLGFELTLLAGFIAIHLGGCCGIYIKYQKKDKETSHIAFGQYICIGVIVSMLWGEEIIRWYLGIFGL